MDRTKLFPSVIMALNLCAAFEYLWGGNWRKFLYWLFAAGLTAAVTF